MKNAIVALQNKLDLVVRRRELRSQLSMHPRKSLADAIVEELSRVNAQIVLEDESFLVNYARVKQELPMGSDGEIDVSKLSSQQREDLAKLQELVRTISNYQ